ITGGILDEQPAQPKARPQVPSEPIAPTAPMNPLPTPITGLPLSPAAPLAPEAPAVQTGFSVPAEKPTSIQTNPLPSGDPRVKIVAHIGAGNIVTDEEVWEAVRQRIQDYTSFVDGQGGGKQVIEDAAKKKAVYAEELRRTIERE